MPDKPKDESKPTPSRTSQDDPKKKYEATVKACAKAGLEASGLDWPMSDAEAKVLAILQKNQIPKYDDYEVQAKAIVFGIVVRVTAMKAGYKISPVCFDLRAG